MKTSSQSRSRVSRSSRGVSPEPRSPRQLLLVCAALALLVLAIYYPAANFEFTNFDDNEYVQDNPHVLSGLTASNVLWAIQSTEPDNWFPLTWMSFQADASMGHRLPGILDACSDSKGAVLYHITNVILHLASTLLLFAVLWKATGCWWRSAIVAAVFAAHPLRIESVAWIAERKDVLSGLFWMAALWFYVAYAHRPNLRSYLAVVAAFFVGLTAKQSLIPLPIVLLALDYWPLGRFAGKQGRAHWWQLLREKIPIFALAFLGWGAAHLAMNVLPRINGAVYMRETYPPGVAATSVMVSYATYIWKTLVPTGLGVFYPHPGASIPGWVVAGSALALALLTYYAAKCARNRPYVTIGWVWYLVTLVPSAGIVFSGQIGSADRYTYLPMIGLSIALAWALPEPKTLAAKRWLAGALVVLVLGLGVASRVQLNYWRNSVTLFERTVAVTSDNGIAHFNLGMAVAANGDFDRAVQEYEEALRIDPEEARYHCGIGVALASLGRYDESIDHFKQALDAQPDYEGAATNLGIALMDSGRLDSAISLFEDILRQNPSNQLARDNLDLAYARKAGLE